MIKQIGLLWLVALSWCTSVTAQKITPEQYVAKYRDFAIREMKRMGVPAAITLAQGLLETENGNSDLVKKSNNHFGIKCKSSWNAAGVRHDDDAPGECFRSYKDAEESYRDHSNYLRGNDRYASLFALPATDYKGWARGLRKAGYATNPKYPEILIHNIEQFNLQQYSLAAANEVPAIATIKQKATDDADNTPIEVVQYNMRPSADNNKITTAVNSVNGHKCITATKGTSLLAIATENDIDLSKLLAYNDLTQDGILTADQLIFLQKKSKTGDADFYLVQQNETVYEIAQKTGMQLKYLLAYNQLTDNAKLAKGLKLYLNAAAETQQASATKQTVTTKQAEAIQQVVTPKPVVPRVIMAPAITKIVTPANKIHQVQAKEGLYAIARKYQVTVQQLRSWNSLATDDLKIGQQLIVSN